MVNIGEWCQFKYNKKRIVGQVIGFIYLNKKTKKESRYSRNYASITDENVGVLAYWFASQGRNFKFINND